MSIEFISPEGLAKPVAYSGNLAVVPVGYKQFCYRAAQPDSYARIGAPLRATFPASPPAHTFLIVAGLALPALKVEIDVLAALAA